MCCEGCVEQPREESQIGPPALWEPGAREVGRQRETGEGEKGEERDVRQWGSAASSLRNGDYLDYDQQQISQ